MGMGGGGGVEEAEAFLIFTRVDARIISEILTLSVSSSALPLHHFLSP